MLPVYIYEQICSSCVVEQINVHYVYIFCFNPIYTRLMNYFQISQIYLVYWPKFWNFVQKMANGARKIG